MDQHGSPVRKIFCIGFHKTGTTSLANALKSLGYRVTGPNWINNPRIAEEAFTSACGLVPQFDVFGDNPWPILYRPLDVQFPNSIFILTLRDPESWIKSVTDHFGKNQTPMRQWIYGAGSPVGQEKRYTERFKRHNHEVLDYFKDRPQHLLVMNFFKGDGWNKLCCYLNKEIPKIPFPHANKAIERGFSSIEIKKE